MSETSSFLFLPWIIHHPEKAALCHNVNRLLPASRQGTKRIRVWLTPQFDEWGAGCDALKRELKEEGSASPANHYLSFLQLTEKRPFAVCKHHPLGVILHNYISSFLLKIKSYGKRRNLENHLKSWEVNVWWFRCNQLVLNWVMLGLFLFVCRYV